MIEPITPPKLLTEQVEVPQIQGDTYRDVVNNLVDTKEALFSCNIQLESIAKWGELYHGEKKDTTENRRGN